MIKKEFYSKLTFSYDSFFVGFVKELPQKNKDFCYDNNFFSLKKKTISCQQKIILLTSL